MPIIEAKMNSRSFNCRVGKGTQAGVRQLEDDVRECSNNYTEECYVGTGDVQGFFMSIRRSMLAGMVDDFIVKNYEGEDKDDLRWITRITITNAPEKNCIRQSPEILWSYIPKEKSLFTNGDDLGLPIGNLPSQMLANFLMDRIDWKMEECGIKYHGRYVDDFYMVSKHKEDILKAMEIIRQALAEIGLTLHPKKFYIQHYSKGVTFTGTIVKPGRTYSIKRTVDSFRSSIRLLERARTIDEVEKAVNRVNSYLGALSHTNSFAIRKKELTYAHIYDKVYIPSAFNKVLLKKAYKRNEQAKKGMRDYAYTLFQNASA